MSAVEHYRERLRQAMGRIAALGDALHRERRRGRDPIAVVGVGLRLPPAYSDPEALFDALLAGEHGISPAPRQRYGEAADPLPPGGYLADIRGFDAEFFGISPREAAAIDPQHRLLLEVTWEALERAGLPPAGLASDRVGVFLGLAGGDYLPRVLRDAPDIYALTGNGGAFGSGRLAYTLGFGGPCLAVDTACSSSLVALHLAVQSLRQGECDVAVVAGASVITSPVSTQLLLRSGALAADGRCKVFDAAADGFARGEGAVAVILRRVADAREGDAPILAVIRGSAVNQDGRSTGLTAPNVAAQRRMLAAALADAGVRPETIGYIETHGTGTNLGDPIEFDALRAVFATTRRAHPCVLGALKGNVGHLEAAAGLAGLVKAITCLRRGVIPQNIGLQRPNTHLALAGTPFVLPHAPVDFPVGDGPRRAGVSAFGMAGTNVHVVLEEAPPSETPPDPGTTRAGPALLTLSARHPDALVSLAAATAEALRGGLAPDLAARTTALHRSHHPYRLALAIDPAAAEPGLEVAAALADFATGEPSPTLAVGTGARPEAPVFVCPGQGSAWPGMGRELLELPAARAVLEAAAPIVAEHSRFDLLEALTAADAPLQRTSIAQPAIVAVTLAVAALLNSVGVRPAAVVGHSLGEVAAAHLAGALPFAEALRLACVRGRVMETRAGRGAMLAAALSPTEAAATIAASRGALEIAAENDPRSTVISGDAGSIEALAAELRAQGVRCRRLAVDYAFHSAQMEPALAAFTTALGELERTPAERPLYSTVTGARTPGESLGPDHWRAGIRHRVRFAAALEAAAADGHRLFLEIGPHPILGATALGEGARIATAMRRDTSTRLSLARALAGLYVDGAAIDLAALHPARGPIAPLPTYPWQRHPHWIAGEDAELTTPAPVNPAPLERDAPADATHELERALDRPTITRRVRATIAAILGLPRDAAIPGSRGLFDLGFDSMMSVELARRLSELFHRRFEPTIAFDHPTLDAIVAALVDDGDRDRRGRRRARSSEPIAIVGMACRLPGGANDVDTFWRLLLDGWVGISEVPAARWDRDAHYDPTPQTPGKMYVTRSGFLDGVDVRAFDHKFFTISPGEARSLDPQQRLLLELTWEALADAGHPFDRLAGSRTGVFVGLSTHDYGQQLSRRPLTEIDPFFATGSSAHTAAGRLAYVLGTHGPALAIDTACSSSLVAAHYAVESLRSGEIDLAIVGGVNLMLNPTIGVVYCQMGALAPDARCKAFDATADGMVRGEGGGVVVLSREGDARRARDRIWAVIRGSAVGHDGHSSGLTVPNGSAQRAVIRDALADAAVTPGLIDYVEAHGTGTSLGDPIEANALLAELRADTPRPLLIASAKANVGHLEAAAGITGLIKLAAALHHRTIPPQPNFSRLNPAITGAIADPPRLAVPQTPQPWPEPGAAGLSAFGVSGTNVHMILGAAENDRDRTPPPTTAPETPDAAPPGHLFLPISARSASALDTLARAWRDHLTTSETPARALCAAAALRRPHLEHRLLLSGDRSPALINALDTWLAAEERPAADPITESPRLAFVFSGQGGYWIGMGRRLFAEAPRFTETLRSCDAIFARQSGRSLIDALLAPEDEASLQWRDKALLHPLMLALQIGLAQTLRGWGIVADAVVGHSSGELAAAVVAGSLTVEDALRISLARSAALEAIVGDGAMAVIGLSAEACAALLAEVAPTVEIAVVNAPSQVVVSGTQAAIDAFGAHCNATNIFFRRVRGADGAGHSHHLDPYLPAVRAALTDLHPRPSAIPFYSTVTATVVAGEALGADYWAANLRHRVRFADAIAQLAADGVHAYLEIGPHPVLLGAIEAIAPTAARVACGTRDGDDLRDLLDAVGRLYAAGVDLRWGTLYPEGSDAQPLPRHPWERSQHWLHAGPSDTRRHPLIDREVELARTGEQIATGRISRDRRDLPPPLVVRETSVLPPALLLEFVRVASDPQGSPGALELGTAQPFDACLELQLSRDGDGAIDLFARADDGPWRPLGRGRGRVAPRALEPDGPSLAELRARCDRTDAGFRQRQRARGLEIPPALDAIEGIWRGDGEALARLRPLGGEWSPTIATTSALELLADQGFATDDFPVPGELLWPRSVAAVAAPTAAPRWIHVTLADRDGAVRFFDEHGRPDGGLQGIRLGPPGRPLARRAAHTALDRWAYAIAWEPLDPPTPRPPTAWLLLTDRPEGAAGLAQALRERGHHATIVPGRAGLPGILQGRPDPAPKLVDLRGLDRTHVSAASFAEETVATAAALDELLAAGIEELIFVTRGGQAVAEGERPALGAALEWGIGPTISLEHPEITVRLIDLDPASPGLDDALAELLASDLEERVAWRGGQRRGARLVRASVPIPASPLEADPEGTWLITGGLGGVGLEIAAWLIDRGARRLILTSRRGLPENPTEPADRRRRDAIAALRATGAVVEIAAVDVADEPAMRGLIDALAPAHPLCGIFHAAGLTRYEPLRDATLAAAEAVFAAKVDGARILDRITRDHPVRHFVCFSSAAATWGAAGLAIYSAANLFLDLLVRARHAAGRAGLSIAWGGWAGGGMVTRETLEFAAGMGLFSSPASELVEVIDACIQADVVQRTIAAVDWRRFKAVLEARGERPLLRRIEVSAATAGDGPLAQRLAATAPERRWETLVAAVLARAAEVLGAENGDLDLEQGFFQLGMDSMMAARLRQHLEVDTGAAIGPTVVLEQPTVRALARWLAAERLGVDPPADETGARTLDALDADARDALDAPDPPNKPDGTDTPDGTDEPDGLDGHSEEELEALLAAELDDEVSDG